MCVCLHYYHNVVTSRVKSDVMTEVPIKVEKMILCPMSRLQVRLNNELRDYVTSEVSYYHNNNDNNNDKTGATPTRRKSSSV